MMRCDLNHLVAWKDYYHLYDQSTLAVLHAVYIPCMDPICSHADRTAALNPKLILSYFNAGPYEL